jgi:hypothetical protein
MRAVWLVEAGVYGPEVGPLLAEDRRQGMIADTIRHRALRGPLTVAGHELADDDCVAGYGTFPFARQIQTAHRWRPGAWCDPDALDCSTVFARLAPFLLSDRHAVLPADEAARRVDTLFAEFGASGEVFVRPTGTSRRRCWRAPTGSPTRCSSWTFASPATPCGSWR